MSVKQNVNHRTTQSFSINKGVLLCVFYMVTMVTGEHWLLYYVSKVPSIVQHPDVKISTSHPEIVAKIRNHNSELNCEISYLDVKNNDEEPVEKNGGKK